MPRNTMHRVVVVGGGFGGLAVTRALRRAPVEVTLVDRRNFHLFQPLLYQVATGSLSPGEIASPLRSVLKRQRNARVVMAEVVGFDLEGQRILLGHKANREKRGELAYDSLIVAAGARHAYFGHDDWEFLAPGMKTVEHALRIRRRMLTAFEAAEIEEDPVKRAEWLSFAVIGAGPTGVELAGQLAEIAHHTLRREFRAIHPEETRVVLIEGSDRVLPAYPPKLSEKADKSLAKLGVETMLNSMVVGVSVESLDVKRGDETLTVPARTKIWAAGVQASPLAQALGEATGAAVDRAGRVRVEPDLTLAGHPEIFVIGDMNRVSDGAGGQQPWPGTAQPAIQEGRYAADQIKAVLGGGARSTTPFAYRDKGNLATIGRASAVADIKGLKFAGPVAWLVWLGVHILFLVGLQNRMIVFTRWVISFLTHGRAQRLITGESVVEDFEGTS